MKPKVTRAEREEAKQLMTGYRNLKASIADYEKHVLPTANADIEQRNRYKKELELIQFLERAVEFVLDPTDREMIEQRYYKGFMHKQVVYRHSSMDAATVLRRMNKALDIIADRLKALGVVET